MARHAHEMYCTNCSWHLYPMLNDRMSGNYTIVCGNCEHKHYRYIKDGVVTEDRHNYAADHGDTIHVMKAACQKEKRKLGAVAQLRAMETAGLLR
jgi:RNase P subunit RPR2